jgi:peptide/nickel transport system permease protein
MVASLAGITLPAFLQGLLLLYFFGYLLPWFPIGGYGEAIHLVLPAVTLGIHTSAWYARVLRSAMLDILGQDYIRTARAKGAREFAVVARHGLRNALGPIVSMVGADMGYYLGGVLVVEKVFGWPGIGSQAWTAVTFRDTPMIMGTVLAGALCMVIANVVVDVTQVFVDPRIQAH